MNPRADELAAIAKHMRALATRGAVILGHSTLTTWAEALDDAAGALWMKQIAEQGGPRAVVPEGCIDFEAERRKRA